MVRFVQIAFLMTACAVRTGSGAALTAEQLAKLPPPANREVRFNTDVRPILEASCIKCHGRGRTQGDFAIDTRETILKGGESGAAVLPGKSAESPLIHLVAAVDSDFVMPKKGSRLTAEQVGVLRAWIDQGVKWEEGITFAKQTPTNLAPGAPALPAKAQGNPIDVLLAPYFKSHRVTPPKMVSDRVFARRAYLDLIGLLPTPNEMDAFLADSSPKKREKLAELLLNDNRRYAEHWFTFWNDALRNDYRGTGYIDGGRKQITSWLYSALATNMPYDKFVTQLISPTPESEGFAKGIVWRGVVNASQVPEMQAAQNVSQIFMGVNLKCASCHDSFINDWTLADAYGLANIFSETPLEMFRCEKPTGKKAPMRFIFSELGEIDPKLPRKERLQQLARLITQKQDGRLTRTIVNRLWARLMGRGLVEPVDEMENSPWNQDLLDWLANDLAEHGYDLKRTLQVIVTSRAYQLPSTPVAEGESKDYVFRGPLVKRMSAEQFLDAFSTATGVWQKNPLAQVSVRQNRQGPDLNEPVEAKWIWNDPRAAASAPVGPIYVRKEFWLPEQPDEAGLVIACDNEFKVFLNGKEIGSGKDHTRPGFVELEGLKPGRNVLAVEANNGPGGTNQNQNNPAGLVAYARIRANSQWQGVSIERVRDFASDATWKASSTKSENWQSPEFKEGSDWQGSAVLGDLKMNPWKAEVRIKQMIAGMELREETRACLVAADSLMTALGRPNREQVVTTRASAATTLQALELTNGGTLARSLSQAAAKILTETADSEKVVRTLYERSLNRKPSSSEMNLSKELLGTKPQKEGVEDLLWALTMLPEFQLIY